MLPLWPNQLLVTFGAGHVAFVYRAWLTNKVLAQGESEVNVHSALAWQDALLTLERLISEVSLSTNTSVHINLASDLVRYLVLPASSEHIAHADKQAYAQAAFREIFGAESLAWAVAFDDAAPATPTLCAAIDQSLLDALHSLALQKSMTLKAIQPYVTAAMNALSASLKKANGMVVIVENTRLVLLSFQAGACTQIRAQIIMPDWQQQLPSLLSRSMLLEEDITPEAFVYAPAFKANTLQSMKDWQIKRIGIATNQNQLQSAYAMLEVMV